MGMVCLYTLWLFLTVRLPNMVCGKMVNLNMDKVLFYQVVLPQLDTMVCVHEGVYLFVSVYVCV